MATHFSILAWKIPCTEWLAAQMVENSLVGQTVKSLPAMRETWIQSLGQENTLEKGTPTHSRILAWRVPWTDEPGGPQSIGWQRTGHDMQVLEAHRIL